MKDEELKALKDKLLTLDGRLQELMENTENDLFVARQIQQKLVPQRLPEIKGFECVARYISAMKMSSETFDIFTSHKQRYVWLTMTFTETFGLSSVLLNALNFIHTRQLDESNDPNLEKTFLELAQNFSSAKRPAHYKLMLARIDSHSLKVDYCGKGFPPPLMRDCEKNLYTSWQFNDTKNFTPKEALWMNSQNSHQNLNPGDYYSGQLQMTPGQRIYFIGSSWLKNAEIDTMIHYLDLSNDSSNPSSFSRSLLEEMNFLMMQQQDTLKEHGEDQDISVVGLEVDRKKIHLA